MGEVRRAVRSTRRAARQLVRAVKTRELPFAANPAAPAWVTDGSLGGERMVASIPFPEIAADMQPIYGYTGPRNVRTARAGEKSRTRRSAEVSALSREGTNLLVTVVACGLLALLLACILLPAYGRTLNAEARVADLKRQIVSSAEHCEALQDEIQQKAGSLNLGYAAVEGGLKFSKGTQRIQLTVPETAERDIQPGVATAGR